MKVKAIYAGIICALGIGLIGCGQGNYDAGSETSTADAAADAKSATATGKTDVSAENGESGKQGETGPADIVDTAVAAGGFGTLAAALKAADLVDTLKSDGPFTVFAPTDEAFAALPEGTVDNLLKPENKEQLVSILTYHVVLGKVDSVAVASLDSAKTVNGAEVTIDAGSDGVKVAGASVTSADIVCSNGIIHVIDAVLLPPSDDASKRPHDGEPLTIEGVGSFKTLFAAIEAAGLKETLQSNGPFTVFAPTDEAFAALPEGTVENLLKPENRDQLAAILTYHVVSGEVPSSKVVELTSVKTVNGAELSIQVVDGTVQVDEATVLKTDVPCEVGLIHAIDKVLMP